MKEIIAVIRMNKVSATKKALVEKGLPGFTAVKVMGRGKLVSDVKLIEERKLTLLGLNRGKNIHGTEKMIDDFLIGAAFFPRRLLNIVVHDDEVSSVIKTIIEINRTNCNVGDGKIFVLPLCDAIRVRTCEVGDKAI